mgnify:FL=1
MANSINKLDNVKLKKIQKIIVVVTNVILVLIAVISLDVYSKYTKKDQTHIEIEAFCTTIEVMKQISKNYLNTEKGYVEDWSEYIGSNDMTLEEALDFIRTTNTKTNRYAHIIDMDTYEAYSTYIRSDGNNIKCYKDISQGDLQSAISFINTMKHMFSDKDSTDILGKYIVNEMQITVISVGTKVDIKQEDGSKKSYLLLRLIPVEDIKEIWIFPMAYKTAEVGVINDAGGYVIQSNSMKSSTFLDFIRGYNFENDYNKVYSLQNELATNKNGLLRYKDSRDVDSYWYYSSFDDGSGLKILGYIPVDSLSKKDNNWLIVVITSGILLLMLIIDGAYILIINKKLRVAVITAENSSKAKTRFLSSMSHDIRTPMNAVLGLTNVAKNNLDNTEYAKECLDKVTLAGKHLLTLINDILDISKIESGRLVLNPASFSIRNMLQNLINMVQAQLEARNIKLDMNVHDIKYEYIIADELRVNQIYINLLSNAIKYSNPEGIIKLDVYEEIIPENDKQICLVYRIQDYGIGMKKDFKKNMYVSFAREEDSRIDKIQGSGLGLSIVKQMVDMMNGSIECESEYLKGTTFVVRLNFDIDYKSFVESKKNKITSGKVMYNNIKNSSSINDNIEQENNIAGMNILVAEDNDLNWEVIRELLKIHNVTSKRAVNGKECIDIINSSKMGEFDMIFMDVQMPVMNGKDATKIIRQSNIEYVKNIPIYAMTADAFADDIRDCINSGMDGHIPKPIELKIVLNVLKRVNEEKN